MSNHSTRNAYGYNAAAKPERNMQNNLPALVHPSRQQAVDFSAPVIHFGTSREITPRQSLKDQQFIRAQDEKGVAFLTAATKEQKLHTIFIGSISSELDDFWMERLLKSVAKLRQWKRVLDGTGRRCSYGFAEYDDPESVDRAYKLLRDVRVPSHTNKDETSHLLDPASKSYVEAFLASRDPKPSVCRSVQFYAPSNRKRTDFAQSMKDRNVSLSALGQIDKVWKDFLNPRFKRPVESDPKAIKSVKTTQEVVDETQAVTIMLNIEDELGDIPEEQRENIAKEITSFRERSAKRDQDRARQVADAEARRLEFERSSRQEARNHVNDTSAGEVALIRYSKVIQPEVGAENMTDKEIARLIEERSARESEQRCVEEERKWEIREASRIAAFQREVLRQQEDAQQVEADYLYLAEKLSKFDDEKESCRASEEYYRDRSAWLHSRASVKAREVESDRQDRMDELRELESENRLSTHDSPTMFEPDKQGEKVSDIAPVRLLLSKKNGDLRAGPSNAEIILADEEEPTNSNRVLVPLTYDDEPVEAQLDHNASQHKLKEVVDNIPSTREELYNFQVRWNLMNATSLAKVRNFVAKKVLEAIGIEEEDLINLIVDNISSHCRPEDIENELDAAIGDPEESRLITTRIWRYLLIVLETSMIQL